MQDVRIDHAGIGRLLLGPQMRSLMQEKAEIAQALYREIVTKRSGRLAASARVETFVGGRRNDRWCGRLIVDAAQAPYAASHEYGTEHGAAARDLNLVLTMLGST